MHWPALDGLRALAIVLVILDHTGVTPYGMPAGVAGVMVFFVLSGFLITNVILRDMDAGRWSFKTFFGNRLVRLAPALLAMVAVVVGVYLLQDRDSSVLAEQAATAALYLEDFFHGPHDQGVLSHTWSLAVEEQFYLLWPFLVPWLVRHTRRAAIAVLSALIAVSIVSRLGIAVATTGGADFAYANILTNGYALLAGCALALLNIKLPPRYSAGQWCTAALVALAVVLAVSPKVPITYITTPIAIAAISCVLVLALVEGNRVFAHPAARYIGRVSYSWYLWHWPLLWLTDTLFEPGPGLLVALGALGIAAASTHLLEEPLRRLYRRRRADRAARTAAPVRG